MFKRKKIIAYIFMLLLLAQGNVSYASKNNSGPEVIIKLAKDNKHKLNSDIYYAGNMLNNRTAKVYTNNKTLTVGIEDIENYTLKKDFINILDNKQVDIVSLLNSPGELYHNADILTSLHQSDINILRSDVVQKLKKLNIRDSVKFINNNLNIHQFVSNATKNPNLFSTAGKISDDNNSIVIDCICDNKSGFSSKHSIVHDINNNTAAVNSGTNMNSTGSNTTNTNTNSTNTNTNTNSTNTNSNGSNSGSNSNDGNSNENTSNQILRPVKLSYPKQIERLNAQQQKLVNESKKYLGTKYVWGGNSLTDGVDCSGFTRELYKLLNISMPRVSRDQAKSGKHVDIENMQVGDLIFFKSSPSDKQIGHVGMYIGAGEFIHASSGSAKVVISSLDNIWYSNCFVSVRRYL